MLSNVTRTKDTADQASGDQPIALQARNQGTNLPDMWDGKLQNMTKLTKKEGFSVWKFRVKTILDDENLEDVIDPALPRPHYTDAKYSTWRRVSTRIAKWLSQQVSDEILDEVIAFDTGSEYADDFYKAIRNAVLGSPFSAFWGIIKMKRSDYKTIDQYVTALRRSIEHSNELGMQFTAFQSMVILLGGVEQELKEFVAVTIESFKDDAPTTITWADFMQLCRDIKDRAMFI